MAELPGWLGKFAEDAKPGYYSNAEKDTPRPHKLSLLPVADDRQKVMFGLKRLDETGLAALAAKLPPGVKVEVLPTKDLSEEQEKWSALAAAVYRDDKVKVTVMFRGREMVHPQRGRRQLDQVCEMLGEIAKVENPPRMEGRFMSMILIGERGAIAEAKRKQQQAREQEAVLNEATADGD